MYIDFEEGKELAKKSIIIWVPSGVLATLFLILFLVLSGAAKIVFGVLLAIIVLFDLLLIMVEFIVIGRANPNIIDRINDADSERFTKEFKKDEEFLMEYISRYYVWKDQIISKETDPYNSLLLAYRLYHCPYKKTDSFHKWKMLFHSGIFLRIEDTNQLFKCAENIQHIIEGLFENNKKTVVLDSKTRKEIADIERIIFEIINSYDSEEEHG